MSVRHFASSRNWATENVVLSVSVGLGTTVQYHYSACGSHAKLRIVVCFLPCENWFSLFKTWHLLIIWCTRTHQKCIRKLERTNRTEKQKILTTNTHFHTGKDRKKSFVSLQLRQHLVIQSFCFRPYFIERVEIENEKKMYVCLHHIHFTFILPMYTWKLKQSMCFICTTASGATLLSFSSFSDYSLILFIRLHRFLIKVSDIKQQKATTASQSTIARYRIKHVQKKDGREEKIQLQTENKIN